MFKSFHLCCGYFMIATQIGLNLLNINQIDVLCRRYKEVKPTIFDGVEVFPNFPTWLQETMVILFKTSFSLRQL